MYVDSVMIFLIYAFSCVALVVSLYSLLTLKELEKWYRQQLSKKSNNAWDHYHNPKNQKKSTEKGHWG